MTSSEGVRCPNEVRGSTGTEICKTHINRIHSWGHVGRDKPIRSYEVTEAVRSAERPTYEGETEEARMWARVHKTDDHWLWTGSALNTGYGQAQFNKVTQTAHRIIWQLTRGEIPKGARIRQTCGKRLCVKPEHLEMK